MASSIVANRNEINWSATTSSHRRHQQLQNNSFSNNNNFVGKFPPFVNPNPNPNCNNSSFNQYNSSSKKKLSSQQIKTGDIDELKCDNTASSSHINNQEPIVDVSCVSFSHSVSYDISAYSKTELRKLKSQFLAELDRVRNLSSRIEASEINNLTASKKRSYPFPLENGKNGKKRCVASPQVMKMCSTVLRKVSNQKAGLWFTSPVDAVKMGLHDYHTVIDRPMDLGTIKGKLDNGVYDSPEEFADDVRLTFNNALRYNPKGHEVNTIAGQYLALFEKWFKPILAKFQAEKQLFLQQVALRKVPPMSPRKVSPVLKPVKEDVVMVMATESNPVLPVSPPMQLLPVSPPMPVLPVSPPMPVVEPTLPLTAVVAEVVERSGGGRGRKGEAKLPKPKAREVNKREMSIDEKCKLGEGLQCVPEDKMGQLVQIIRKRSGDVTQEGDEVVIDIEAFDTETLWELDRFVTNYKKMESKIKRQSLLEPLTNNVGHIDDPTNQDGIGDMMMVETKKVGGGGGGDVGEEDVDIGDEMPVNNFPPLEIDKDDDKHQGDVSSSSSSSSSSDSDDSSSSDSESGSSSDSDSDVDDAQSRDNESKNVQH